MTTALAVLWGLYAAYFLLYGVVFFMLAIGAWIMIRRMRKLSFWQDEEVLARDEGVLPRLSLLVPAYNESKTIMPALASFLASSYPDLEIVVVNDGSSDDTMDALRETLDLDEAVISPSGGLPHQPVMSIGRSRKHPRIIVLDKLNGGKADALNCAISYASGALICCVDADVILPRHTLLRAVLPHVADPEVVATGGMIRLRNNCSVTPLEQTMRLPRKLIELFQVVEYLRSFTLGRAGWDIVNGEVIISGAFGVFRADLVRRIGGYQRFSIGEDMELVVRLHRHCRRARTPYKVLFVPDAACYTEAPDNARDLFRQRNRWQQGLLSTLLIHRRMLFNPRYGALGFVVMPYFLLFELLSPVIEITGAVLVAACLVTGVLPLNILPPFLLITLGTALFQSLVALWLNTRFFDAYNRLDEVLALTGVALLEGLTYHFPMLWVRTRALYDFFSKFHLKGGWVSPKRI